MLRLARGVVDHVVVDVGFALEDDEELSYDTAAPRRNATTLTALEAADHLVVVGSADPVGLQRLVRGVQDLAVIPSPTPTVVVNKVRASVAGPRPERSIAEVLGRFAGMDRRALPAVGTRRVRRGAARPVVRSPRSHRTAPSRSPWPSWPRTSTPAPPPPARAGARLAGRARRPRGVGAVTGRGTPGPGRRRAV